MKTGVIGWALWALCIAAVAAAVVYDCLIEPSQVV